MPQLGATFVPGGFDDYYMPEVVAPAPQRVTPQVPQNMQDDLQRMELEAREVEPNRDSASSPSSYHTARHEREPSLSTVLTKSSGDAGPAPKLDERSSQSQDATQSDAYKPFLDTGAKMSVVKSNDAPSFSPFPKVKGDNIPPSDEEKEEILWNARKHVLHSNNVSMQISWARDTLAWVEIVMEAQTRELAGAARPPTPKVEHELRVDAISIIDYLSGQEHPEALFMKAKWLEFGKFGFRADKREAYNGYKKSADLGYGRAGYRMGMLYENSNDFNKAIEHYYLGLKLKDSAASYRLGMMCLLGQHGHTKDLPRGLELISNAADTADEDAPQGAYVYGMLIARDLPDINIPEALLPVNLQTARMYIEKAAYLGFAKAQLKMGQAYELCQLGCDFNPAYSLHYYGLAAKQGQPEAALGVSRWFLFGYEGIFNKNEQLAFKYAQEAAVQKLPTGEFAMGYYHEIGIHVQKDLRQARTWYELAAEHGNKDAAGRLESLNASKSLTKADHETTTMTRIKSQHGSQRGKRPDRFKQPQTMPTLSESAPSTPVDAARPMLPEKGPDAVVPSPKVSPQPSPRTKPTIVQEPVDGPDRSRLPSQVSRPPAFNVNLDTSLAMRPKSTAPYPEDDRPAPLNLNRPKSTAPYPEDDMPNRPPLSPHFNPSIRASAGPQADRPMSAFGIRPISPGGYGSPQPGPGPRLSSSQSAQNLIPPAGTDPRGRMPSAGWEPQRPSGYRQPSPGPVAPNYPSQDMRPAQRPATTQPYPVGGGPVANPSVNRLTKQNPNYNKPQPSPPGVTSPVGYGPRDYGQPVPPAQPGRDYGPRTSSRPTSVEHQQRPVSDSYGYARPDRVDSLPPGQPGQARLPTGSGPRPMPLKDRPDLTDPRAGSAPPSSQPRPQQKPSPSPSAATVPPSNSKPQGQGPATFEAMGIPQGKNDDDCVVM